MPERPDFVFVLGTGRCGSTLLHEVLARHRDTGFVSNVDDRLPRLVRAGRWNGPVYRPMPPCFTGKGRLRFAPSEAYRLLDAQVSPLISAPCRDLRADDVTPWLEKRFRRFFESRALAQGSTTFLHKFTGWPRAGFVHKVFPRAHFVNVIRDGRAVASSWLQMSWWSGYKGPGAWQWGPLPDDYAREWEASGHSFVLLAGLAWKLLMDAVEPARQGVPSGQWLDVRYEDLVADPRQHMERVLRFVGLEWTEEFGNAFARYHFDATQNEAFQRHLDPQSVHQLETSLAGHLRRYGYPTSDDPRSSPEPDGSGTE